MIPKKKKNKNSSLGFTSSPSMQSDEAVATILLRESYTRERHYMLMRVIVWLLILLSVSFGINIWSVTKSDSPVYFATDERGRITEITPIHVAIQHKATLLSWVGRAVVETNTYSFSSWREDFAKVVKHFTQKGWQDYFAALTSSGNLQLVVDQKYNVSSALNSVPIVIGESQVNGVWTWVVEFELLTTFESANGKVSSNHAYHVTVVRVPEDVNPNGLAISGIIARN